ncbi:MAG: hypothetical protein LIP77_10525 [Planctomycetes bacterium]|nr:hypothetical protein [Planctomycetota bacterium]
MAKYSGDAVMAWCRKKAGWLFGALVGLASTKGWRRWALLALSLMVFAFALCFLFGGPSYEKDPSALVPRSAGLYAETRDMDAMLRTVSAWGLWRDERRTTIDGQWSQLQVDVAGAIGDNVAGLGTRLPLAWLTNSKNAAWVVAGGDEEPESWALFLHLESPADELSAMAVEPGLQLTELAGTRTDGVFSLSGEGNGQLFFGVIGPWLIVSSSDVLPFFAFEGRKKPALSLANSRILDPWTWGMVLRAVVDPNRADVLPRLGRALGTPEWIAPDARLAVKSSKLEKGGRAVFSVASRRLGQPSHHGFLRWLGRLIWVVLGVTALAAIAMTLLCMIGWSAWLKAAAIRAGIRHAPQPAAPEPSPAFVEDIGAHRAPPTEAVEPDVRPDIVPDIVPETDIELDIISSTRPDDLPERD